LENNATKTILFTARQFSFAESIAWELHIHKTIKIVHFVYQLPHQYLRYLYSEDKTLNLS